MAYSRIRYKNPTEQYLCEHIADPDKVPLGYKASCSRKLQVTRTTIENWVQMDRIPDRGKWKIYRYFYPARKPRGRERYPDLPRRDDAAQSTAS